MFCTKCGKEIHDEAVVCPFCGCATNNQMPMQSVQTAPYMPYVDNSGAAPETSGLATAALVFAFLMPIVGLILGIIGTVKYKTQSLKNKCIAAIPVSIVAWVFWAVILANMY